MLAGIMGFLLCLQQQWGSGIMSLGCLFVSWTWYLRNSMGEFLQKGHNFPPDSRMNWLVFSSQRSLWPYKSCFWSRLHTLIMANDTQMSKKNNMMKWQHIVFRCHCNIIMSCHYPAATECKLVTIFHIWSDNEFVIPVSVYTAHFHKTVNSHFCLLSAPPSTEYTDLMLACC